MYNLTFSKKGKILQQILYKNKILKQVHHSPDMTKEQEGATQENQLTFI